MRDQKALTHHGLNSIGSGMPPINRLSANSFKALVGACVILFLVELVDIILLFLLKFCALIYNKNSNYSSTGESTAVFNKSSKNTPSANA